MPTKQIRRRVKIGVDGQGKPVYKYYSGKTEADLYETKKEMISKYITGEANREDQLFGPYAINWYTKIKAPTVEKSTQDLYRTALNKEILPVFGDYTLRAISAAQLKEFFARYAGASKTRLAIIRATLKGIFAQAYDDKIIDRNPAANLKQPKSGLSTERRPLTEDERRSVERVCRTNEHGAYLACMYYLGCRPGEVRGLMWKDFDFKRKLVSIERDIDYKLSNKVGNLKNSQSRRSIPIPNALSAILLPLKGDPDTFLFTGELSGKPLSKTVSERIWIKLMVDAGLAEPVKDRPVYSAGYHTGDLRVKYVPTITPHTLRHNYITMLWESGVDVYTTMRIVGHKSIKTTMNIYTHLSNKQMDKTVDEINGVFDL